MKKRVTTIAVVSMLLLSACGSGKNSATGIDTIDNAASGKIKFSNQQLKP